MSTSPSRPIGDWQLFPATGTLSRGSVEVRLTLQQQRLLDVLVEHAGEVVDKDTLFELVWDGAAVEENAVARCVSELRRLLGDDARSPRYIETLPRRGYRWIATPSTSSTLADNPPPDGDPLPEPVTTTPSSHPKRRVLVVASFASLVVLGGWFAARSPAARQAEPSAPPSAIVDQARRITDQGIEAAKAGRFDDAAAAFEQSLGIAHQIGDHARAAAEEVNLARVHMMRGEWKEAALRFAAAEPVLATQGDDEAYAMLLVNLGTAHAASGNLRLARHPLERSAVLFERAERPFDRALALSLLGEVLVDSAALDAAQEVLDQALVLRQASDNPRRIANSRITLAVAAIERGETEVALRVVEPVLTTEGVRSHQRVLAARLQARAHLADGRLDAARQAIDEALKLLDSADDISETELCRYWLPITHARVEAAEGSLDRAAQRLTALLSDPGVPKLRLIDAEARLALAEVEVQAGAIDSASVRLAELLDEAEAAGWHLIASKAARVSAAALAASTS